MTDVEQYWGWLRFADVLLHRAAVLARARPDLDPAAPAGGEDDPPADLGATVIEGTAIAVAEARDELKRQLDTDSPFASVCGHAALTPEEAEAFAVLAAVELDADRQVFLERIYGVPWLTPFSLSRMFDGLGMPRIPVAPDGGLRRSELILPVDGPSWATSALRLAPVVPWWLLGEQPRDADLPADAEAVDVPARGEHDLVLVSGVDRVRRLQAVIGSLAAPRLLVTPLPDGPREWAALIRQATLSGSGIVIEVDDRLDARARSHIDIADHLPWAITSTTDLPINSLPRRPWRYQQPSAAAATPAELAAVFGTDVDRLPTVLSATQVQHAAELAPRFDADPVTTLRRLAHGHLDRLATRVRPAASWEDLILPEDRLTLVREVLIRQRHNRQVLSEWGMARGASASTIAMFTGQSGTGKTLAAEVIAGALDVDLYQVDVSQLVSKYIGETEKNLREVFDAAEAVPCVLFFDEADALFGKRSEVSDAHDRYANIEVAYLLQRLERHNGIVILASNLASNLDRAFARRIHVSVDFPVPGVPERRRMWDRNLPDPSYRAKLDLDQLAARFELTGGNIRNAALRAAFLAADAQTKITMPLLLEALRREFTKLGRHFPS